MHGPMEFTASQIAERVRGELKGDPHAVLRRLRPLDVAEKGDLSFLDPT